MSELYDLARHQYDTGEYGRAHLRVPKAGFDELKAQSPKPEPLPLESIRSTLMGIPIVVDDTLPYGSWRLVDNSTGEVLREGVEYTLAAKEGGRDG